MKISFNNDWQYINQKGIKENIRLPHNMTDIPFNYFDQKIIEQKGTYLKKFYVDNKDQNKLFFIEFNAIGHRAEIFLNDNYLETHLGGYDTFKIDLTKYIKFGENNILKIIVDSSEDKNIPPFGNVVDYLCYGGIYKEVNLYILNKTYIKDLFIKPFHKDNWYIEAYIELTQNSKANITILSPNNEKIIDFNTELNKENNLHFDINNPMLWDIDNPYLYKLILTLENGEKIEQKFGIRSCIFLPDGFYLNDKKIKLLGLNRHQSFPYVGYAVSKSLDYNDAKILKQELGCNAVRTSHYMNSKYFLDACDELGLLVFTESPGWQHLGDSNWQELVLRNMKSMVNMNKNHPSVILYGARINESVDNHELYVKTNELLHKLDPTRQTGGVRCYKYGEELEDVYTYNDFIDPQNKRALSRKKDVVKSKDMPYFVSEFNGHMFPTKNYDDTLHQQEHLERLLRAQDQMFEDNDILGLFYWHFFDYNTHKDFGSGDKICYHGLCDMFRNHKIAASSLAINRKDDYFELSNLRIPGDIPATSMKEIIAMTNLDYIKVFKNDLFIKQYDHTNTKYKHIKNSPIIIDDFIGNQLETIEGYSKKVSDKMKYVLAGIIKYGEKLPLRYKLAYLNLMLFHKINYQKGYELYGKYIGNWGSKENKYRFEAYKDDKLVKTITLGEAKELHLDIDVSSSTLVDNDTYDMSLIRIRTLDQNNNMAIYYNEAIELINDDKLEIIGPKLITFKGGRIGTIVKTKGIKGKSKLIIKSQFETKEIEFEIN